MGTWGELLKELNELGRKAELQAAVTPPTPASPSPHDILRRKYLKALSERTGRATIVYATAWHENKEGVTGADLSVALGDVAGFMEAVSNVDEKKVDLFLSSPGGSPEAAEAIMSYLRTQFDEIRVVVPLAAMSAATMMALAADEIVMGHHSQLGPIDPQLSIMTPEGPRSAPAQAIIDQFARAKQECTDAGAIAAWMPILRGYGPGLLATCDHARTLSEDFATRSLETHMFAGDAAAHDKAEKAAKWFADFNAFRSHGRRVSREDARALDLKILDMEADKELQDAILSVHHTFAHTLAGTNAFKIIENHHGRAWVQQKQQVLVQVGPGGAIGPGGPGGPGKPGVGGPGAPPAGTPQVRGGNRAARRRQERGGS
jgi:hypothetical protein